MDNIEGKVKKWIESIQREELEGLTEDIQANIHTYLNKTVNKHIFKLLLYLSHTADKCDRQKYVTGNEIYKLTCLLCSSLTAIPDNNKFVSSLFHIVRCLLAMHMYVEASKVCFYLKIEALSCSHVNISDTLIKISYLWYNTANNIFLTLQKDPLNFKCYYELKDVIKFELDIIQIVYKNYTKQLLMKISSYLDKIASVSKESNICFVDFYEFVIKYLNQTTMSLNDEEKYAIFHHMLHIISRITCENINESSLESGIKVLNTISNCFKRIIIEDEECYQCLQQFESLCLILIKPVELLIEKNAKSIQDLRNNYVKIAKKYRYAGSIKWTTFSIVQVLEPLFVYWETCMKAGKKMFLQNDILVETMNLVAHISICFVEQLSDKCKSCRSIDCTIRKDIYNAVVIKMRCINLVSKLSTNDLTRDICMLAQRFLEENIACIYEMKKCKCKCWTQLWCTCGALLYNLGIISERFYEESVSLFSLLCTSIVQFEGIQQQSRYLNLQNPIHLALHRLSTLHYNCGMFREAMTTSALNALLSYNDSDSKAFRMWANIKHKSITSKEIMDMTILACLRIDKTKIEELGLFFELSQYDLIEICLREIKGLQEAKINLSAAIRRVLNEMMALKVSQIQYAWAVQMLAYHLLNFDYNDDILDYLKQTVSDLEKIKLNNSILCLQANLEFYIFVSQLHIMNKTTRMEMENTKFALYAPRLSEIGENESHDVVPAYTMINMKEDSRLVRYLQIPLKKWNKCLNQNVEDITKGYEPAITLHTLIIAGEYSHLHRYQECEINIWELAYKLASELQDNYAIIYVTGRSISIRHINHKWISYAKQLAVRLKDTNDKNLTYAIATFWISLSDFYFECNMYTEARKLLNESRQLSGISFFSNKAVYLYSLDRILYNYHLYKRDIKHEEYTRYIVETLYTMVNLNEELCARKCEPQDKHLFGFDILLSTTVNLSLRMNSLLSFREIGAHLVRRLKTAQTLGAIIRVAEILKSLCYIDLSRSQLNDCDVKLQGLEHILDIETFKASMDSNSVKLIAKNISMTPIRIIDPIRDVQHNDASPVLRNKVFDFPEFMCHKDCNCYKCTNVSYRYLVLISTHIRAQLYALQKHFAVSLQHFHGAFKIKENLTKIEKCMITYTSEYSSWQARLYITDYVLMLLNYSYFLKNYLNSKQEQILNISLLAIKICSEHKLKGHPIYVSVREQMLNNRFQKVFNASDYSSFTVPDSSDIDIHKYVQESKVEESICFTPTNNARAKKPITLRRNRTPPLLKLTKVSMNFSDDEDNNSLPPSGYTKTRSHSKLTKRKILDVEYCDNFNTKDQETKQSQTKLLLKNCLDMKEGNCNDASIRDIVIKISLLTPDVSEYLYKTIDLIDEPLTNKNMEKLIELIEAFKVHTTTQRCVRKTRHSSKLISSDCNQINQVIDMLKDLIFRKREDNIDLSREKK